MSLSDMNTDQLIEDAILMLETIEQCHSPAFKATAARQLVDIAVQIAAQYYVPAATPEPEQPDEPAEPRPVIDLAMKYRTRDGREVTGLQFVQEATIWAVEGTVGDDLMYWTIYGGYDFDSNGEKPHPLDLTPTGEPA